ncbi:MAG: hypothetical protein IPN76_00720 [Saprospiraceae bacterium]|nr:hypothetical protein [Saprospiraceae bacterium]
MDDQFGIHPQLVGDVFLFKTAEFQPRLLRLVGRQVDEVATGMDDFRFGFFGGSGFVFAAGNGGEEEEEKRYFSL